MNAKKAVCAHCGRVSTDNLVPLGYLCVWCCNNANDVSGRGVFLFDASGTSGEFSPAAVLGAKHDDGTLCGEVAIRRRVYVDGIAYEALGGMDGANFVRSLTVVEPPAWQTTPGVGEEQMLWDSTAAFLARQLRTLRAPDYVLVVYETGIPKVQPYAQISTCPNGMGLRCQIVSERFLPANVWPLDRPGLLANGWLPPDELIPSWHRHCATAAEATSRVLNALRWGRGCTDHKRLSWRHESIH